MYTAKTLLSIIRKKPIALVTTFFIFLTFFFATHNLGKAVEAFSFDVLPIDTQISLALQTLFDIKNTFAPFALTIVLLASLLGAISTVCTMFYFQQRAKLVTSSKLYHGFGFIFAVIGTQCAACGTALISLFASLGLTGFLAWLPYHGQEFSVIGITLLIFLTIRMVRQVNRVGVC